MGTIEHTQGLGASRIDSNIVLRIRGLRQVVGIPGSRDTFTLKVAGELEITAGSFVGILGQTGCGKTTLLTVLGLLRGATPESSLESFDMAFRGDVVPTNMREIWQRNRSGRANRLRCEHLGFALQSGDLLPSLTVAENIAFPLRINGWERRRITQRVEQLIDTFGLYRAFEEPTSEGTAMAGTRRGDLTRASSLADARVNHLSGGQYQRVALARAIAHQPEFVFVDEPTASLNRGVARIALQQLSALRSEDGCKSTIFMVTHDEVFAQEFCNELIRMRPVAAGDDNSAAGEVVFDSE